MPAIDAFTEDYKEKCKQAWYLADCVSEADKWMEITPEDDMGRKPSLITLRKWRKVMGWDWWAENMNAQVQLKTEEDIVAKKVAMFKRHAEQAVNLIMSGADYLEEHGHDSSASAVTAIVKGIQLERESVGGAEMSVKLASMDNSEVLEELKKTIQRAIDSGELEQVINVEAEDEKEDTPNINADT